MNKYGLEWERLMNAVPQHDMPEVYTSAEVCAYLQISRGTFYKMRRRGELHTIHVGRHHRVSAMELERLMAEYCIYCPPSKPR
jgi:excisionase family DNA binding protein